MRTFNYVKLHTAKTGKLQRKFTPLPNDGNFWYTTHILRRKSVVAIRASTSRRVVTDG